MRHPKICPKKDCYVDLKPVYFRGYTPWESGFIRLEAVYYCNKHGILKGIY